jgi:hypothetical protein
MATTTFSGPVVSTAGFVGAFTGGTTNLALTGTLAVTGASTLTGAVTAPAGVTGDVTGDVTGNVTGNVDGIVGGTTPAAGTFTTLAVNTSLVGAVQSLTDAGAVNLTDPITALTTTGAAAITLADGVAGQIKIITMVVDGGDATLTPATPLGFATITFNDAGDGVTLVYTAVGWVIVGNNGATVA